MRMRNPTQIEPYLKQQFQEVKMLPLWSRANSRTYVKWDTLHYGRW
jgi:hypothetical protein